MSEVHHFSYGIWTPLIAYIMSCTGALLGLLLTTRARAATGRSRAMWLLLGTLSIGGTGIWVMHFIAMLGFSIPGAAIRYDVPVTLFSALIAVLVVGVGMFVVGFGAARPPALLVGGTVTGLGVASMHYTGMAAMHATANVGYNLGVVLLSVLIAVVAATAALWFTVRVRGAAATVSAALIMGLAVSGMHYTGMAAMRVRAVAGRPEPSGALPFDFLLPLVIAISVVAMVLLTIVAMSPTEDEMRHDAEMLARIQQRYESTSADGHYLPQPGYFYYRSHPHQGHSLQAGPHQAGPHQAGPHQGHPHQGHPHQGHPHQGRGGGPNPRSARVGRWFGGEQPPSESGS